MLRRHFVQRSSVFRSRVDLSRRGLLLSGLSISASVLFGCGGGGGGDDSQDAGSALPETPLLKGAIVTKTSSDLNVMNFNEEALLQQPTRGPIWHQGVSVSRSGLIADVWGNEGVSDQEWNITISNLDGVTVNTYVVSGSMASPTSAAELNSDGSRLAYSVNEWASPVDSERVDRTYVADLPGGEIVGVFDGFLEPVFVDSGELLLTRGDRIHVFDSGLHDHGSLPIDILGGSASYCASPDGRYVAYEDGNNISMLDRTNGSTWRATDAPIFRSIRPVFSPDGNALAFLQRGSFGVSKVHVIAFVPGITTEVEDSSAVLTPDGGLLFGSDRIGWAR